MRVVLVCALVAMAGCAEGTDPEAPADEPPLEVPSGNGTLPMAIAWVANNTTLLVGMASNVTLGSDLNATAAANISWEARLLEAAGNETAAFSGTGLPAVLQVTLPAAGNFTLTANASAPGREAASATLALVGVAPALTHPEPVVREGGSQAGNPGHGLRCLRDGVDGEFHEVAPAELGWRYRLTSGYEVYWWNGGSYVSRGGETVGGSHAEVCDTSGSGGRYTLVMWHPEAPEPA